MSELDELLDNNQVKKTVKWEEDGKELSREITLQEPDARTASRILGTMTHGDNVMHFGDAMEIIMANDVIVNPKYNYKMLNEKLTKEDTKKSVELTNRDGKKVTLYMNFPDYRTAFDLAMYMQHTDGTVDLTGMIDRLIASRVIVDGNNKTLDWDWFDDRKKGYGLMGAVVQESITFLMETLGKDGVFATLLEGFQLATEQVSATR